jgi:putative acetyltransferase
MQSKILGTGFLVKEEMGGVYVHPQYQRNGIGTAIIMHLHEIALKSEINRIWLDATPFAKPLYLKLGFTVTSPMTEMIEDQPLHYFKMGKILRRDK